VEQQILQWGLEFQVKRVDNQKINAYRGSLSFDYARVTGGSQ